MTSRIRPYREVRGGEAALWHQPIMVNVPDPFEVRLANSRSETLPILISQDLIAATMYRRIFCAQILATMIPDAAFGVIVAYPFASTVPAWVVEIVLGLGSFAFSLQQIKHQFEKSRFPPAAHTDVRWLGTLCGLRSGFTSTIAHAGSPPFQFYVMPKGLDRDMYVGTNVLFFAATNLMKASAFLRWASCR